MNDTVFTKFAVSIADAVQQRIEHETAPLLGRIVSLEQRAPDPVPGERGEKGERGDAGPQGERGEKGDAGPQGENGAQGDRGEKGDTGDAGPQGERGEKGEFGPQGEVGPQGERGEKGDAGAQGERGEKGDVGATPAVDEITHALRPVVAQLVEEEVKRIEIVVPEPVHGKDGADGLPGAPGRDGVDGQDGQDGREGKDGRDGRDALDVVVLSSLSPERAYARGTWVQHRGGMLVADRDTDALPEAALHDPDALRACGWRCVVRGLASLELVYDGERSFVVRSVLTDGTHEQQFKMPVVLQRGVYDEQREYEQGDSVTYAGSSWLAQRAMRGEKPGTSDSWRLQTKRGADGKDASVKESKYGPVSLK